jgi:SP family sugar porter-like MFS transporter
MSASTLDHRQPEPRCHTGYVWAISLVAAMGGLLFGYDWVVIGGAKPFFERYFELSSSFAKGWANSCALVGCLLGALLSGGLSDRFGRRRLLMLSGLLFLATGIGTALAQNFGSFIAFRILGGMGIGLASNISPMYIAEVSPAESRGKFVSLNQLTIVLGILLAQMVNWMIAERVPEGATSLEILNSWNGQYGWRWMFGAGTVPAALFFVMMFLVPESPRWLVKNAQDAEAERILGRIAGPQYAARELAQIQATLVNETERVDFRELLEPKLRPVLVLGVTLAVLQQWCGINVIFNYAEEIFQAGGYGVDQVLLNILATGVVNLAFTFVAIFTVDRLGRRKLMLAGEAGLALIYAVFGLCLYFDSKGPQILILVVSAIACYACTLAPVTWVVISEIFPNRIRGAAMSIAVFALWAACFLLTFTFPTLNKELGTAGTFWMYGLICVVAFVFFWRRLPETKGKSLEQIEHQLM